MTIRQPRPRPSPITKKKKELWDSLGIKRGEN
jgi:hypothetical protein